MEAGDAGRAGTVRMSGGAVCLRNAREAGDAGAQRANGDG